MGHAQIYRTNEMSDKWDVKELTPFHVGQVNCLNSDMQPKNEVDMTYYWQDNPFKRAALNLWSLGNYPYTKTNFNKI